MTKPLETVMLPQPTLCACGCLAPVTKGSRFRRGHWARIQPIEPDEVRFWAKVEKTPDCWLWTGAISDKGYGYFNHNERGTTLAHHFLVGKAPRDLEWDHTCHTEDLSCDGSDCIHRRCIRPSHLEAVTREENIRRQHLHGAVPRAKKPCTIEDCTASQIANGVCRKHYMRIWRKARG